MFYCGQLITTTAQKVKGQKGVVVKTSDQKVKVSLHMKEDNIPPQLMWLNKKEVNGATSSFEAPVELPHGCSNDDDIIFIWGKHKDKSGKFMKQCKDMAKVFIDGSVIHVERTTFLRINHAIEALPVATAANQSVNQDLPEVFAHLVIE